jgi:serine-type D-Ala-D-Ala carboxypeptidase (penicillin-binding protein 5/6)
MRIKTTVWETFFASFITTVVLGVFSYSGVIKPGELIKPEILPPDPFEKIEARVETKRNDISLSRPNFLISEARAAGDYDKASSYIVVDADSGEVIAEKSSGNRLYIASITKIMTAITALDLAEPSEVLTVSETAPKVVPTNMGLVPGQKWTIEELLHGLLLASSNDAAQAIKEEIDQKYGGEFFIRAMNAKAKYIGLKNTSFDNPQGFDGANNYSTSEDLAILSLYIYKNYPLIAEIAEKEYQYYPATSTHKQADLNNWNGLLGVYPGAYGLKIGNTGKAQKTTVVSARREGKNILVVLLGAPGVLERDLWAGKLLDLGFENFNLPNAEVTEEQLRKKYSTWRYF